MVGLPLQELYGRLLGVALLAICGSVARSASGRSQPRTEGLAERLILRDGQQGFAGESGTVTTIETDGRFRVARFVNDRVEKPHRSGRLSPSSMRELARAISQLDLNKANTDLGEKVPVNAHRLELRLGKRSWALALPPGKAAAEAVASFPDPSSTAARFLEVWTTAQRLIGPDETGH